MSALDAEPFPKIPLIAAITLVGASLAVVGGSSLGLLYSPAAEASQAEAASDAVATRSRDLRFFDQPDGSVRVKIIGAPDHLIERDSGGFVRGIMRGLTRERAIRGVGRDPVFRLTEWSDGSLTIEDTGTGRSLNLSAYGPTNRLAFEAMLQPKATGT
jgi:putative photosynthetic complex assembly protein